MHPRGHDEPIGRIASEPQRMTAAIGQHDFTRTVICNRCHIGGNSSLASDGEIDYGSRLMSTESKSFLTHHLIPQIFFFTAGLTKGSILSIDVTDQCNLRCQHCYFFEQEQEGNWDIAEWETRIQEMKKKYRLLYSCTWVGGEPLLRKPLIENLKKHFLHNLVVTNGTIPLPDWPDVQFHVSIDGNEEAHDRMRRQKGLYRLMKKNCSRPDLNVKGAMCVTSINVDTIEEVLEDWRPHLKGMMFDFYTPIEGLSDDLWTGWEKRDAVIDRLLELKKTKYGEFIAMEERVLELMRSKNSKAVTDNCLFAQKALSLTTTGQVKEKCMLGPKADCDRCGCVVPYYLHYRVEKSSIVKMTWNEMQKRFGRLKDEFNALTPESQRSPRETGDATRPS